jgi:hypothetical protein
MKDPDGDVWYQSHQVDAAYIIPHVSSHITALSRISLWRHMKTAVQLGGNIYYSDTDSLITDIELPTSTKLGDLKDEYPGEELAFLAVQPKVYLIEKMRLNKLIDTRRDILRAALDGDDSFDASTLDASSRIDDDGWLPSFALEGNLVHSPPFALKPHEKVTMKGFPMRMRTKENLLALAGGSTVHWEQLEKVRSLARTGFRHPPKMRKVKKSFQSQYDKRVRLSDGSTRAIVLDEPLGGFDEFTEAAE